MSSEKKILWQREYQKRNKETLLEKKRERRELQRNFIQQAKAKPCTDCRIEYPFYVMQFDHVFGEKRFNLNRLAKMSAAWQTIENEIAKCEVVCANCHSVRTYERSRGLPNG